MILSATDQPSTFFQAPPQAIGPGVQPCASRKRAVWSRGTLLNSVGGTSSGSSDGRCSVYTGKMRTP